MSNEEPRTPQLSDEDLEKVVGGESVSLNFSKVQFSYGAQKGEGTPEPPAK